MERLTEWTGESWIAVQRRINGKYMTDRDVYAKLAEYENLGLEPKELKRELLKYRAKEAQNRKQSE